jgi:hypothetical protein
VEALRVYQGVVAALDRELALESLAWVACARAQPRWAARLGGAAQALREALGVLLPHDRRPGHEHARLAMCAALVLSLLAWFAWPGPATAVG